MRRVLVNQKLAGSTGSAALLGGLLWLFMAAPAGAQDDASPATGEMVAGPDYADRIAESVAIALAPTEEAPFVGPPVPVQIAPRRNGKPGSRPRIAEDVDLSEPVGLIPELDAFEIGSIKPPEQPKVRKYSQESLVLLETEIGPSTSARLSWTPGDGFESIAVPTPVLVVNGAHKGPTMCITAAVHGDELNGIEVVRRVMYDLDSESLTGAVIGVPIVNLQGFRRASRYLPDRRDLNRFFPGNTTGSSASRLAHSFFTEVIEHCDTLVDVHTGSFHRTNLPQLRADLESPEISTLTSHFGTTVVLHSPGADGTLRRAATDAGIPAITLEAGEPARVQEDAVAHGARSIKSLLHELGMTEEAIRWRGRQAVYYRSRWERADQGGVLLSNVDLGEEIEKDQLLGTITDPITNVTSEIRASREGRILGMALPQFVMPGFAAYRIGIDGGPPLEIADPNAPSDSDDLLDTEDHGATFTSNDEIDTEEEATLDARDATEDSE